MYSGGCCSENNTKSREFYRPEYNDLDVNFDETAYQKLIDGGERFIYVLITF